MTANKGNRTVENIDESFLLQSIKEQEQPKEPVRQPSPETVTNAEPDVPATDIPVTNSSSTEKPKETGKRKRSANVDYGSLFLQRNEFKTRQCVYISQRIHTTVSKIVRIIADKDITVGGYIDSILAEHLETHKDEIIEFYKRELSKNDENNLI